MNIDEKLLSLVKSRKQKKTEFNYGILTADRYVRTLQEGIGLESCYKYASTRQTSFDDVLTKAGKTLVYSNPGMVFEKKLSVDNFDLPKNTLMVFNHVLTTSRKDRDGDILRSQGAEPDPKMLLLWQHVHTLPIGKMVAVTKQNKNQLSVVSAIVDMNELCHDAAVMIDNDMGRFSHGFRALEWEELKEEDGDDDFLGFDIKRFEIMEESLVSVPANSDAETQEVLLSLVEDGKMTSPLMKEYGKSIRENRNVVVPGTTITVKEQVGDSSRELTCSSFADLKAAKDAGLIGGENNEDKSRSGSEKTEGRGAEDGTSEEADGEKSGEEAETTTDTQVEDKSIEEEKSGRTLSKANETKLLEVKECLSDVLEMDNVSRVAKALLREAMTDLDGVLGSLGEPEEVSVDKVDVKQAMSIILSESTKEQRDMMLDLLKAIRSAEAEDLAKQYQELICG